jgi:lysophospholipase L1-like esterase
VAYAKVGINSANWNQSYLKNSLTAKTVVISLGANDHSGVKTKAELQRIREKIGTNTRVFWIDPGQDRKPTQHAAIIAVAQEYGDLVLPRPKDKMSPDGIHPTAAGYRELAKATR